MLKKDSGSASFIVSLLLSLVVIAFLVWLIYIQKSPADSVVPGWILFLPTLNALANALSAVFLVRGVILIKKGRREEHKRAILWAVFFSAIFLAGYITFYFFHGDRKFIAEETFRRAYLSLLASHILVSIVSLPMILHSLSLGLRGRWETHRKWAKKTFPAWLYVNVTGVLIHIIFSIFSEG